MYIARPHSTRWSRAYCVHPDCELAPYCQVVSLAVTVEPTGGQPLIVEILTPKPTGLKGLLVWFYVPNTLSTTAHHKLPTATLQIFQTQSSNLPNTIVKYQITFRRPSSVPRHVIYRIRTRRKLRCRSSAATDGKCAETELSISIPISTSYISNNLKLLLRPNSTNNTYRRVRQTNMSVQYYSDASRTPQLHLRQLLVERLQVWFGPHITS